MLKTIKIPPTLGHQEFEDLLAQQRATMLGGQQKNIDGSLIFDFSENKNISMLGLLLIAKMSDELRSIGYNCMAIRPKENRTKRILAIMGLINPTEEREEMQKYFDDFRVPIQRCKNGKESLTAVNKLIPIIKKEMNPSEIVLKALNWALWEVVDNAGVHGYRAYASPGLDYTGPVYFCAASLGENIDIAILDQGQGILSSFRSSGKHRYQGLTNGEALRLAIQNNESGHPNGSPGFGLFGCSEIARIGKGQFLLISGANRLLLSEKGAIVSPSSEYKGTMVSLRLDRNAPIDLLQIFNENSLVINLSLDELIGK
jgi:hypothetical protein